VLNLRGEHRFEVAPLAPPAADVQSAEEVALSPAVQLFLERASAVAPDFALDATNAAAVAGVCRRLDGMPLALELAAARIPMLSPAGLLRRLERRLDLLTGGPSDLPERQRTLRDTLGWSYELLDEAERTLFRRLSVFVGGWTLESAEMVCSGEHLPAADVLNVLGSLTDKSLVQRLGGPIAEPRFGMLESVREYGLEQLEACGETAAARRRHLDWCLALAERLAPERFDPAQAAILKHEQDNLRAALDWAREHREVALGLRMAGALAGFWWVNGYPREGSAWLDPLLALAEGAEVPTAVRAKALHGAAVLANAQGEYARSKALLKQSAALFRESGDVLGTARALASLGGTAYDEGDLDGAMGLWKESLRLAREAGDPGEVAESLGCLGEAAYHLGDLEGAERCLDEASAIARQAGRTDIEAWELGGLANVARRQGDLARATALQRRALAMQTTLGDRRQIAISLQHLAQIQASAGRGEPAARLLGAATALRELIGAPQPAPERSDTEQTVAGVWAALGEPLWATAFQAGRSLSLEQAIAEGLDEVF
jgi:non-specific serine/threonine protein kinase